MRAINRTQLLVMTFSAIGLLWGACMRRKDNGLRILLPGQVSIRIPAPAGTSNRGDNDSFVRVRYLFETAMYPGEREKMEIREYCGLEDFSDTTLSEAFMHDGFTIEWALRVADSWPSRGLRFRRGALYGDVYTVGDAAHKCRAFLIRVQVAVEPEKPVPWAEPFLMPCNAFNPSKSFPYPPDTYPVQRQDSENPQCQNPPVNSYYKFLQPWDAQRRRLGDQAPHGGGSDRE